MKALLVFLLLFSTQHLYAQQEQLDYTIETAFEKQEDGTFRSTTSLPAWMGADAYFELSPEVSDDGELKTINIMNADFSLPNPHLWMVVRINEVWLHIYTEGRAGKTNPYFIPIMSEDYQTIKNYNGTPMDDAPVPPRTQEAIEASYESLGFTAEEAAQWKAILLQYASYYTATAHAQGSMSRAEQGLAEIKESMEEIRAEGGNPQELQQALEGTNMMMQFIENQVAHGMDIVNTTRAQLLLWESGVNPAEAPTDILARFKPHKKWHNATFFHAVNSDINFYQRSHHRPSVVLANHGSVLRLWLKTSEDSVTVNINGARVTVTRFARKNNRDNRHRFEGSISFEQFRVISSGQPTVGDINSLFFTQEDANITTTFARDENGDSYAPFTSVNDLPEWMGEGAHLTLSSQDYLSWGLPELHIVDANLDAIKENPVIRVNGQWFTLTRYGHRGYFVQLTEAEYNALLGYDGAPINAEAAPPRSEDRLWALHKRNAINYWTQRHWKEALRGVFDYRNSLHFSYGALQTSQYRLDRCTEVLEILMEGGEIPGVTLEETEERCTGFETRVNSNRDSVEHSTAKLNELKAKLEEFESVRPLSRK